MRHLLHAADLSHQLLLLLLLPGLWCGWRNLHLILFVCRQESEQHQDMFRFCSFGLTADLEKFYSRTAYGLFVLYIIRSL